MYLRLKRHFVYWMLPTLVVSTFVAFYFSGNQYLELLIAPYNREYGLMENTQHLLILCIGVSAILGYRRATHAVERWGFAGIAVLSFLVFGEEISWGYHYVHSLTGIRMFPVESVHNIGDNTDRIKLAVDTGLVLMFVFLPLYSLRSRSAWVNYLAPAPLSIMTVICAVLVSKGAHYLNDVLRLNPDGYIRSNISEFRETFIYYLALLYVYELALRRQWPTGSVDVSDHGGAAK